MNTKDFNDLAWPAMRYALGRKTYVVEQVCNVLIKNAHDLTSDNRYKMGAEIIRAINRNEAGMDMDVKCWQSVLEVFYKIPT